MEIFVAEKKTLCSYSLIFLTVFSPLFIAQNLRKYFFLHLSLSGAEGMFIPREFSPHQLYTLLFAAAFAARTPEIQQAAFNYHSNR